MTRYTYCNVIFDFDIDGAIEEYVCEALGFDRCNTSDLTDEMYNDVCDFYCVPRLDERFKMIIRGNELDEQTVCNEISNRFGWYCSSVTLVE